jgi:hypothetical protein
MAIEPEDIKDLKNALGKEPLPRDDKSFGPKVGAWIAKMVKKAATGAWDNHLTPLTGLIERAKYKNQRAKMRNPACAGGTNGRFANRPYEYGRDGTNRADTQVRPYGRNGVRPSTRRMIVYWPLTRLSAATRDNSTCVFILELYPVHRTLGRMHRGSR